MRAGPLSDAKVVALLNRHFVPVYAVNEDYGDGGSKPADERREYNRIYRETLDAKLSAGTVHVYLLTPEGHVFDSMHVVQASRTANLIAMLERAVKKFDVPAGEPVCKPAPQSTPPSAPEDALVLHLTARGLTGGGHWDGIPSENWIVLSRADWTKLLPADAPSVGQSWELDRAVAAKVLAYFYPQSENNDVSSNRIDQQSLTATVVALDGGTARARIDGRLKMKHTFYPGREDDNVVDAALAGYLDFDIAPARVHTLRLVTDRATYSTGTFGVAVRSLP